ncbi:DUF4347 domain-containing protein, partial [Spirulina subsalsa FACHB-351]
AGADLLIYSCFTALGELGQGFVQRLAALTGLDVAASTNATGSENYGGDWDLEYRTGSIEVGTPFRADTLLNWEGRLATFTVGDVATPTLEAAITAANADGAAPHTIRFAPGITEIVLTTALPEITQALTITGDGTNVTIRRDSTAPQFRIFFVNALAPTTFEYLTIRGGAGENFGTGINSFGQVTLNYSTVTDNQANRGGGGINGDGGVILNHSTVSGNSANEDGGGIRSLGGVTLINSTVSGNSAGTNGGGIRSVPAVTLTNSTVAFNQANGLGGGVYLWGATHTIHNSIIANNTSPTAPDIGVAGTPTFNISHSLIGNTTGMSGNGLPTNGVNGNLVGVDPKLAPLTNNGGPTQTHALGLNSPALNGGSNDLATGLTTDQRGAPGARIVGGTVDMGAFEWQGLAITPVAPLNQTVSSLPANVDVSVKVTEAVFGIAPVVGASVNFTANGATGTFSNGTTVLTNGEGMAINFFNGTEALGNFSVLAAVPGLTPVTFNFAYTPPVVTPPAVTPSAVTPPVVTPPVVTPTVITPSAFTPSIPLDFALLRGIWLNPVDDMTSSNLKGVLPSVCAAPPQLDVAASEESVLGEGELSPVDLDEYCLPFNSN